MWYYYLLYHEKPYILIREKIATQESSHNRTGLVQLTYIMKKF